MHFAQSAFRLYNIDEARKGAPGECGNFRNRRNPRAIASFWVAAAISLMPISPRPAPRLRLSGMHIVRNVFRLGACPEIALFTANLRGRAPVFTTSMGGSWRYVEMREAPGAPAYSPFPGDHSGRFDDTVKSISPLPYHASAYG